MNHDSFSSDSYILGFIEEKEVKLELELLDELPEHPLAMASYG